MMKLSKKLTASRDSSNVACNHERLQTGVLLKLAFFSNWRSSQTGVLFANGNFGAEFPKFFVNGKQPE